MTTRPALTEADLVLPGWQVAPGVRALVTTRDGGVSEPPYGRWRAARVASASAGAEADADAESGADEPGGLNLGRGSGDDLEHVEANRARLAGYTGVPAAWLKQIHGPRVVDAAEALAAARAGTPLEADASVTAERGIACTVMIADCMPVLIADSAGRAVGAAHAGWRGLAAGVIERTAERVMALAGCGAADLHVYLGPSIGPAAFEVGEDVREAFLVHVGSADAAQREATAAAFVPRAQAPGKYLADLPALARLRLAALGVRHVSGGDLCTVTLRERFYSYRRDRITGRMAAMIWIEP
ncbi:peptidoglycan editing factor PgeF [Paraburkholderia acidisoli]|uniref:Purine nucleoside phosphorylase n=1 Tax=Paraburkholderia acidisoli TaxID=2571748 RepID=A0A7Z2GHK2_9BURK|nr:peptidoglycan editing factor PgeF [Paraburkholderia acidisoli]QGZ61555.1 peptidoglycan editing factor PgeF [Paraburkholderia acidisoli]